MGCAMVMMMKVLEEHVKIRTSKCLRSACSTWPAWTPYLKIQHCAMQPELVTEQNVPHVVLFIVMPVLAHQFLHPSPMTLTVISCVMVTSLVPWLTSRPQVWNALELHHVGMPRSLTPMRLSAMDFHHAPMSKNWLQLTLLALVFYHAMHQL